MDLRQLRYFSTIVECGSLSKAAAALNVAQPALSLHVRNMEAELGMPLLFRGPRGVVATEAGAILLRNARLIIDQFALAVDEIKGHDAVPAGEVRLGLPGTISQILAVPLILEARRRYPQIRLRIAEAMSGFVLEWLRDMRVDLGVLYIPVDDRSLVAHPVLTESLWLLGPIAARFDVGQPPPGPLPFAQAVHLPLILPSGSHGLRELIQTQAAAQNLSPDVVLEVDSYANIKGLVEAGLGYSILPLNAITAELHVGKLQTWQITQPDLTRSVHLVKPTDRPIPNAVAAIESLCLQTLAQLVHTGTWIGAKLL